MITVMREKTARDKWMVAVTPLGVKSAEGL